MSTCRAQRPTCAGLYRQARLKHTTPARGWLQGLRWGHVQRYAVRSLDARLLLRVFVEDNPLLPDRCLGSVTLRLATIRALCRRVRREEQAAGEASSRQGGATANPAAAAAAGEGAMAECWCPPRWFKLRAGKKRKEALRAEAEGGQWHGAGPSGSSSASASAATAAGLPGSGGVGEAGEEEEGEEEEGEGEEEEAAEVSDDAEEAEESEGGEGSVGREGRVTSPSRRSSTRRTPPSAPAAFAGARLDASLSSPGGAASPGVEAEGASLCLAFRCWNGNGPEESTELTRRGRPSSPRATRGGDRDCPGTPILEAASALVPTLSAVAMLAAAVRRPDAIAAASLPPPLPPLPSSASRASLASSASFASLPRAVLPLPPLPATTLVRVAGHRVVRPPQQDARDYVEYQLAVGPAPPGAAAALADGAAEDGGSGEGGGWWVERRFCQFAQLDHELHIQHASALQARLTPRPPPPRPLAAIVTSWPRAPVHLRLRAPAPSPLRPTCLHGPHGRQAARSCPASCGCQARSRRRRGSARRRCRPTSRGWRKTRPCCGASPSSTFLPRTARRRVSACGTNSRPVACHRQRARTKRCFVY